MNSFRIPLKKAALGIRMSSLIYCVEDDENIQDLVVYTLENTGFQAEGFEEGKAFKERLEQKRPDLVLLDVMLPGEDGIQLLKDIRGSEDTKDIPVIMVTAKGAEFDKVKALDLGADDYVTKPFGMMELVSRIKAVLRRAKGTEAEDDDILALGKIAIDTKKHEVTVGGKEVNLTLKEYELLRKLMVNSEVVLTRDQLLADVWGYDFDGETRTVDVHVRTLRQKLGKEGDRIETVRGVGYRIRGG